jgi:hypothetical protein
MIVRIAREIRYAASNGSTLELKIFRRFRNKSPPKIT